MNKRDNLRHRLTAGVALVGFSLATMAPRTARASGTGSATSSSLDSTISSGLSIAVTLTTTAVSISGIILLVYFLTKKKKKGKKRRIGDTTEAWLASGILASRGDLGVQLGLILEDPGAYHQLSDEAERGRGPGLDALSRATGFAADDLAARWVRTASSTGPVALQADAKRFVSNFTSELATDLELSPEAAGAVLWELQREDLAAAGPGRTHRWTARWLGVDPEAVVQATQAAFSDLETLDEGARRRALNADPELYLGRIAVHVETLHGTEVEQRIACALERSRAFLPQGLLESIGTDPVAGVCAI